MKIALFVSISISTARELRIAVSSLKIIYDDSPLFSLSHSIESSKGFSSSATILMQL
jgi:hypothetical protein